MAILATLPEWLPRIFCSDVGFPPLSHYLNILFRKLTVTQIASVLCLTAIRSYWYSTSYLTSLKWIMFLRLCIWAIFMGIGTVIPLLWDLWQSSREAGRNRAMNRTFPTMPNAAAWFKPKAAISAISSSFSSPNSLPLQHDPLVVPKAQMIQRGPQRAKQSSEAEASAEELFYQSFGRPTSRGRRTDGGSL